MGLTSLRRNRELAQEAARALPSAPAPVPFQSHEQQLLEQHRKHQLDLLKIQKTLGVSHADIAAIIAAPMPADKPAPEAPAASTESTPAEDAGDDADKPAPEADDKPRRGEKTRGKRGR